MKNSNLLLLMAAVFALASCGTYTQSAQQGGTQFRNSIYYSPNSGASRASAEQQYLAELEEKTEETLQGDQSRTYDASTNTMTVKVGDNNVVDIDYNPSVTYQIVDDQESYEARLRKFDSPTYTINIEMDSYPMWNGYYSWYRPSWRWYSSWSSPWYNPWHYGWNYPWYGSWYSPWYADYAWGYYDPFYDPFYSTLWGYHYGYHHIYYPVHRPVHKPVHKPGFHPGHGPGAPVHGKDIHYGKRNDAPSYKNVRKGNPGSVANGGAAHKPAVGSVTRRPQSAQNKMAGTNNDRQNVTKTPDNKKNATVTNRNNNNNSNRGSYTRTTNQQTRSGSYSQSRGFNNGRSSGNTNNGGGSSYRRR